MIKNIMLLSLVAACTLAMGQDLNKEWPVLKTYKGVYVNEVAMPLGGIGTGGVSIGGRGDLKDWELMNRGAIGWVPAFKLVQPTIANAPFFALYYKPQGQPANVRILEGPVPVKDYYGDWGADAFNAGFPRFEETSIAAAYPLAQVSFKHAQVPLSVRLEAFNPLIVGNEDKSGMPVAVLRYVITNTSDKTIDASVCGMIPNFIGVDGWSGKPIGNKNEYKTTSSVKGIYMSSARKDTMNINWGTMALTTLSKDVVTYRTSWAKLGWNWTFREFWDDFITDGELTDHPDSAPQPKSDQGDVITIQKENIQTPPATLAVKMTLQPGETKSVEFLLTWHFPNRHAWDGWDNNQPQTNADKIVGNYYTTQYRNAWDVAEKTAAGLKDLEKETVSFVKAFVQSDVPEVIKEAALFNLNNLRSQTMFRTADGYPFGWEGTGSIKGTTIGAEKSSGWGFGTCFHVWNYESTIPFLFGNLSTKFREVEFNHATHDDGAMSFRVGLPLKTEGKSFKHWAADGQMGTLIKMYREWQLSGDDQKLKAMWPNIKKAMSFAWTGIWDVNKDGVMEGSQHNTMDINYLGPNPQMAAWYLGALRASEEMAIHLNDKAFAKECHDLYVKGRKWVDANLFNGEYYEHHIPEGTSKVAQLGKGCLVDQLVGQYLAHTAGLGYVLDQGHVQTTLKSIMKYNHVKNFNEHFNTFRSYGLGNESGLIMASYPKGELLDFPFPYYTEIMTGFEYSAGIGMIYEGQVDAGLQVFKSIRDRFDGNKRNPFNEGEYGHRYARAMAAWGGVIAYTGFNYSAVKKSMNFNSRPGKYFWSNGYQYGTIEIADQGQNKSVKLTSLNGPVTLGSFTLNGTGTMKFKTAKVVGAGKSEEFVVVGNDKNAGLPVNAVLK
ncbi:MAG: GH116 family glycosyl-hydrolase [Bacteroidota bacterium]